jgi:transcriptional regulator with XRE-family HTH domain
MTQKEFRANIRALKMSQRALAATLGLAVSTVNRWAVGDAKVPQYAIAYIECRTENLRLAQALSAGADDAMTKLSPEATRFIDAAIDEMADINIKAEWASIRHDPGTELPDSVARAVLTALSQFERRLRARLNGPLHEEEASDLSNDLGFVCAIEDDLRRQIGTRP